MLSCRPVTNTMLLECRFQVLVYACAPHVQKADPRQQPSSHRAACWSPTLPSLSSTGSEVEKKHKKIYESGQRQFNRKKKARRWHKGNHSPPSTSKPMPNQPVSSRQPGRQPPLTFFLYFQISWLSITYVWCGLSSRPILVSCPSFVPSQSLAHPMPTH